MIGAGAAAILGGTGLISGLLSSGEGQGKPGETGYTGGVPSRWHRRKFATDLAAKYPSLFQMPGMVTGQGMDVLGDLLGGQLAPGASEALGVGAQEMMSKLMGQARVGVSGTGGGPEALLGLGQKAGMQVTREIAPMKAELATRARETGVGAMPGWIDMLMKTSQQQQQKWQDIANLFLGVPGAAWSTKKQSVSFGGL